MKYCYFKGNQRVTHSADDIVFDDVFDICVAGLGTAGSMAAIAAARAGARVVGIEQQNVMGGLATRGCVNTYYYGSRGGLFEEINRTCINLTHRAHYADSAVDNNIQMSISPAVKAFVLEKMAEDASCTLLLGACVTGVYTDDAEETILGISALSKGRMLHIGAKIIIDSTRNSVVCAASGCSFLDGRRWDGRHMMYSKGVCTVSDERPNLDQAAWFKYDFKHLPLNIGRSLVQLSWINDSYFDEYNPEKTSAALLRSNAGIPFALEHYDEKNKIVSLAGAIGTRETPEVETETVYTFDDFARQVPAKDILYYTFAPLDTTSPDPAFEGDDLLDWRLLCRTDCCFSVGIPRGALIPKGKKGLLVASKALGVGHTLSGAVRMKADMEKCGEAAGVLAAQALRENIDVRDTDYVTLRTILSSSGCYDERANRGYDGANVSLAIPPERIVFPTNPDVIKAALADDAQAGKALWVIRNHTCDEQVYPLLPVWFSAAQDGSVFQYNTATALLLTGDRRGAAVFLRELQQLDACSNDALERLIRTVYLLGKAEYGPAVPELEKLLARTASDIKAAGYRIASFTMIAMLRIYLADKTTFADIPAFIASVCDEQRFHLNEIHQRLTAGKI
ncbi:MAG TPA: FAD-dependent oxidoreductase [Candidatus Eisenbergiella merdipullorum]|uniref:FAD-dependent oxidoreductase n=1 Tax=Candidatus Eisenbergiella merdipullorum TaxID=2838553 RepID=A0A9D2I8B4_9FIRM|nr:FAD-dependent oxidoreductase [Candidatus Eisenbergiella merdipullorum]